MPLSEFLLLLKSGYRYARALQIMYICVHHIRFMSKIVDSYLSLFKCFVVLTMVPAGFFLSKGGQNERRSEARGRVGGFIYVS